MRNERSVAVAVIAASLFGGGPSVGAGEPSPPRIDAGPVLAARLRAGERVRIATATGDVVEGAFVAVRDGEVVLEEPARHVPVQTIQTVWVRGRAIKTGAIIGGLVLGAATAVLYLFAAAFCEEDCGQAAVGWGAVGFSIGGLAGALTGGLAGAAFPKWHRVDLGSASPTRSAPVTDPVGSLSLQGGWGRGRGRMAAGGGAGSRMGLSAELPGAFAVGLEMGRFALGLGHVVTPRGRSLFYDESVRHFGVAVTKTRDHGAVRPYALASLGRYSWRGLDPLALDPDFDARNAEARRSFVGASLGGGLLLRCHRRLSVDLEGRWHTSLDKVARPTFEGPAQHWNMVSIAAGVKVLW